MIKKIEYMIAMLITSYVRTEFPKYCLMLTTFAQFLDENSQGKTLNIEDNLTTSSIYSELLDFYLNDLLAGVFDVDVYGLTDDNKKSFIGLSQKLNGLKGNKQSFAILFQTLSDLTIATEGGTVEIPDLGEVAFDEPGTDEYAFTYRFRVNTDIEEVLALIKNVHPAGFVQEVYTTTYDGSYDYDGEIDYDGEEA